MLSDFLFYSLRAGIHFPLSTFHPFQAPKSGSHSFCFWWWEPHHCFSGTPAAASQITLVLSVCPPGIPVLFFTLYIQKCFMPNQNSTTKEQCALFGHETLPITSKKVLTLDLLKYLLSYTPSPNRSVLRKAGSAEYCLSPHLPHLPGLPSSWSPQHPLTDSLPVLCSTKVAHQFQDVESPLIPNLLSEI